MLLMVSHGMTITTLILSVDQDMKSGLWTTEEANNSFGL